MNRKGIAFCVLTVAMLIAVTAPKLIYADFEKIRINLLGMTCEFCERALEKNLSRVPGVQSARAWLDKGVAEVTLKKGAVLDIEKLARAVKDGGLTLKDIQVAAKGRFFEQEGKLAFKVDGNNQLIFLQSSTGEKVEALVKNNSEMKFTLKIAADQIKEPLWTIKAANTQIN